MVRTGHAGRYNRGVADVVYLLITAAFFVLAIGFVRVCDRIIGPEPAAGDLGDAADATAATGDDRPPGAPTR